MRQVRPPAISLEEIKVLLEQGTAEGVFERSEHEMVTNVLNLDDRQVKAVLTPRSDVVYLDVRDPVEVNRAKLRDDVHAVVPLCDGGLDHVIGVVRSPRVLARLAELGEVRFAELAEPALYVPETMSLMKLLEQFKRTHLPVALVVDEYGAVEGLVSLTDVISAIVGELPSDPGEEPSIVRRDDGSWLMDGGLELETVARTLGVDTLLPDEGRRHFHTLGGLAMRALGRVPRTGDVFEHVDHRFEVVDMDGNRVDRVLVSRTRSGTGTV
jgi:putative hemolysin